MSQYANTNNLGWLLHPLLEVALVPERPSLDRAERDGWIATPTRPLTIKVRSRNLAGKDTDSKYHILITP